MNEDLLIEKMLSGTATYADQKYFQTWIKQNPRNGAWFEACKILHETETSRITPYVYDFDPIKKKYIDRQKEINAHLSRQWTVLTVFLGVLIATLTWGLTVNSVHALKFDHTQLKDVMTCLESEFDVSIHLTNTNLEHCFFTGTFYGVRSAEEVVRTIAGTMNLQYHASTDGNIKVSGTGCDQP